MKKIKFTSCMGDEVINPTFEQIECLIKTKGTQYWDIGSGQSSIKYEDEHIKSTLCLMMAEGYGFYLEYYSNDTSYVTKSNDCFEDVVDIYIGGDPVPIPRAFFLNIEDTLIQVKKFFIKGEVDFDEKWVKSSEANWGYGYEIEEESNEKKFTNVDDILISLNMMKRKHPDKKKKIQ